MVLGKALKISIVIAVLDSHKVVIRQLRHFKKMPLPDTVELVLVDDGSDPPLKFTPGIENFSILYTNDKRPWTQGLARNIGARYARGEYLLFTDIDHIITKEVINAVLKYDGYKMVFPRYFGIFDRNGNILSDASTILKFGLDPDRYKRRGLSGGHHGNTYAIRRDIFFELGGYDPRFCTQKFHMGGNYMSEERDFNRKCALLRSRDTNYTEVEGPKIYCYPVSKFRKDKDNNPFGLFHHLSLEQVPQPDKR